MDAQINHSIIKSEPLTLPPVPQQYPSKVPLLFMTLLFIISTAAAIYFYRYPRQINPQPSPTPTNIPTSSIEPIMTWETYRNIKFNYQFKHPANLIVRPFAGSQEEQTEARMFKLDQDGGETYALVSATPLNASPTAGLEKIDGINGYDVYMISHPNGLPNNDTPLTIVELHHKGASVQFIFQGSSSIDDLASQILSTFKFIDCSKNEALNLAVKLPLGWSCNENLAETDIGSIAFTNGDLVVSISDGGRGPYCGDGPDPEKLCNTRVLKLSDKFTFTIYGYNEEDKEIFGGLGKTNRNTNRWISITYAGMEGRELSTIQKNTLLQLLNSIEFSN